MSFIDNIIVAAYTSPISKTRTQWRYRNKLSSSFQMRLQERRYHKITGVEYYALGDDDNAIYAMECVFDGETHDDDAKAFVKTLREPCYPGAPGILEHPIDGAVEVVVRNVRKTTDPTNDAGQTIIEVEFPKQLTLPEDKKKSASITVEKQFSAVEEAAQTDFEANADVSTSLGRASLAKSIKEGLEKTAQNCNQLYRNSADALNTFNNVKDDILRNIDTIVKTPATLAAQAQIAVASIAGIPGKLKNKLESWADIYSNFVTAKLSSTSADVELKNEIATRELIGSAVTANTAKQIVNQLNSFSSADDILNSYYSLVDQYSEMTVALDTYAQNFDEYVIQEQLFSQTETAAALRKLIKICGDAVREAVEIMPAQVVIELPKDMSYFQICYEYYGECSDETIESFIDNNNLTLLEMLFIDKGRTVFL